MPHKKRDNTTATTYETTRTTKRSRNGNSFFEAEGEGEGKKVDRTDESTPTSQDCDYIPVYSHGYSPRKDDAIIIDTPPPPSSKSGNEGSSSKVSSVLEDSSDDTGDTEEEEFEVQKIIDQRMRNNKRQYKVRWKGYSTEDDTWEPKENLSSAKLMVDEFEEKEEKKKKRRKNTQLYEQLIRVGKKCKSTLIDNDDDDEFELEDTTSDEEEYLSINDDSDFNDEPTPAKRGRTKSTPASYKQKSKSKPNAKTVRETCPRQTHDKEVRKPLHDNASLATLLRECAMLVDRGESSPIILKGAEALNVYHADNLNKSNGTNTNTDANSTHQRQEQQPRQQEQHHSHHRQEQQPQQAPPSVEPVKVCMSISELRAIAHGAGQDTRGMERADLEAIAEHFAPASAKYPAPNAPPTSNTSNTSNFQQPQQKPAASTQQQHQPPPMGDPTPPLNNKYTKATTSEQGGVDEARISVIRYNLLVHWALMPPIYNRLRPIGNLLWNIHTVFPPAFGVVQHSYFMRWRQIIPTDLADENKLKKVVRKLKVFLHPDKLPRDFNGEHTFVCKMLWDISNDAWDEFLKFSNMI